LSHLTRPLSDRVAAVMNGCSDVLTPRLYLTKLLEYDIQLLDHTPVKLPPYRLVPPKWLSWPRRFGICFIRGSLGLTFRNILAPYFWCLRERMGFAMW
jgi:hypothetical protein